MHDNKDATQEMWSEVDMMLPPESPQSDKPTTPRKTENQPVTISLSELNQQTANEFNEDLFPPVPTDALVDDIQAPDEPIEDSQSAATATMTNEVNSKVQKAQRIDAPGCEVTLFNEPALPAYQEGCYAKPNKYRPSIKAFYPHLGLIVTTLILAMFPSLAVWIFSQDDLTKMPEFLRSNLDTVIQGVMAFCSLLLAFVVMRQKMNGTILVYGDYLEYKRGLLDKTTIHYADIRTIDVRRCLATMYAPVGDFHIISSRNQHIVLQNLLNPFRLKDAILDRKKELNIP